MAIREINLITSEILAHRYAIRHIFLWSLCLFLSLSMIFGFYFYQTRRVLANKGSMSIVQDRQRLLGLKMEEIQQIQKDLENLSQQQAVLETIKKNQPYSLLLVKLADIMNQYTWLSQLTLENRVHDKVNASSLLLTGFSFSNEDLGDFLHRLGNEPLFKRVILKYSRESEKRTSSPGAGESERLIHFQIECELS